MNGQTFALLSLLLVASSPLWAASAANDRLREYYANGASTADANRGAQLWQRKQGDRACTSCHGDSPQQAGQHVKTGKLIDAMAPSINAERFRDSSKTEKWFLRNCKWTFGRECSVQEKADILAWLGQQ
jgi:hypothetical protein